MTPLKRLDITVYVIEGSSQRQLEEDELAVVSIFQDKEDFQESAIFPRQHEELTKESQLKWYKDISQSDMVKYWIIEFQNNKIGVLNL